MKKVYLFIELIIYMLFMTIDLSESILTTSGLKFSAILICFLYVWFYMKDRYLKASFFFTVIADVFLLFTNQFVYGIAVFCIVQMIYLWRIAVWKEEKEKPFLFFHTLLHLILTTAVLLIAAPFLGTISFMESLAVFYFISILDNLYQTFMLYKERKDIRKRAYFFFGMLFFFLCDCNVGIYNILQDVWNLPEYLYKIYEFSTIGMWMFYLPAQILLVLSGDFLAKGRYKRYTIYKVK